jgi:ABC-2 type transport system ATP-binding protein
MNIISVRSLKKIYGNYNAVDDISFSIEKSEIFGLLGPNGAGKTSTINMMIGLARPTKGEIIIDGIDVRRQPKKAQAIMGIVPDESNLYNEMDGFDNLCFCASLYGMKKKERETKARQLLEKFHLNDIGRLPFKAYSKGMRRKLTIAAALIHSPSILFLDEPTTGIDIESARQIRKYILKLKKQNTTVFITTHYIEEAERICDKLAFIVEGKIVAEGPVNELMKSVSHGYSSRLVTDSNIKGLINGLQAEFKNTVVELTNDRTLVLKSENRIPLLPIIMYLERNKITVYEARELTPTLEDVFVKITGIEATRLRKEKEKGVKT